MFEIDEKNTFVTELSRAINKYQFILKTSLVEFEHIMSMNRKKKNTKSIINIFFLKFES